MLGHILLRDLAEDFEVCGTVRPEASEFADHPFLGGRRLIGGVRAEDMSSVARALLEVKPQAAINCIGIVKQREEAKEFIPSLLVNALFPHRLSLLCRMSGTRLIHFSTDCIFSGAKDSREAYTLNDACDPVDLYGHSKLLGEVDEEGCLTLRTSFIGPELRCRRGLLEWLLSQKGGRVSGYSRAIFSGFTTIAIAGILKKVLRDHPGLSGIWQVASRPVNKFDLLSHLVDALELDIAIEPDETVVCNRSLDGSEFNAATNYEPPSWNEMVKELAADMVDHADA